MTAHEFLWLDLETTGLDPATGLILEVAAVLCEDARGDDFSAPLWASTAVYHTPEALAAVAIDDFVRRMHTSNGLFADVRESRVSIEDVDMVLETTCEHLAPGRKHAITLAGSSVHFDLAWVRVHLPKTAERLSHRVFDVSTLRRAVDSWGPKVEWPVRDTHRALPDIMATIEEARLARAALFGGAT